MIMTIIIIIIIVIDSFTFTGVYALIFIRAF